jgi:thiosulfate/3-mercaptopyruvate sulfurtransferase
MQIRRRKFFFISAALFLCGNIGPQIPLHAQMFGGTSSLSAFSIPQENLIQPAALNQLLQGKAVTRPTVLQVGSHMMFSEAHIPGSIYAGPGAQSSGLDLLASKVGKLKKNDLIVIYCGCCPWSHCPNVGPAFKKLHDMGFTHVKVLYLANNFGDDWVNKGYRVEQGQ